MNFRKRKQTFRISSSYRLSCTVLAESDNKQNRMLFKLAVEMSVMMNLMAATQNIDKISLERLRGECVKEVKRLNGAFSFEDALDWQKG